MLAKDTQKELLLYLPFDRVEEKITPDYSQNNYDAVLKGDVGLVKGKKNKAVSLGNNDGAVILQQDDIWQGSEANPLLKHIFLASVVKYNDKYHMFYGNTKEIFHGKSEDGFKWQHNDRKPVLTRGKSGSWDNHSISLPSVWIEDGTWYMFYRGRRNKDQKTTSVGLARSRDGIHWEKEPKNPVLEPRESWERGIEIWGTIKIDSTYYAWYNSLPKNNRKVGLATSKDLIHWERDPENPIFTGLRYCPFAFKYEGDYYLLMPQGSYEFIELYRSSDPRFYPSNREYLKTVKATSNSDWDQTAIDTPWIVSGIDRDIGDVQKLRTYYWGGNRTAEESGLPVFGEGLMIEPDIEEALTKGINLEGGLTVQAWVYPENTGGLQNLIGWKTPLPKKDSEAFIFSIKNGRLLVRIKRNKQNIDVISCQEAILPDKSWSHLTFTYSPGEENSTRVKLYIDSQKICHKDLSAGDSSSYYDQLESGQLRIGSFNQRSQKSQPFRGRIDELKIFSGVHTRRNKDIN